MNISIRPSPHLETTSHAVSRAVRPSHNISRLSRTRARISTPVVCGTVAALDAVIIGACGFASAWTAHIALVWPSHVVALGVLLGTLASVQLLNVMGSYRLESLRDQSRSAARLSASVAAMTAGQLVLAATLNALDLGLSAWLSAWLATATLALMGARIVLEQRFREWRGAGRLTERAALLGATPLARQLLMRFQSGRTDDVEIVGVFDDHDPRFQSDESVGRIDDLIDLIRQNYLDTVIITVPLSNERRIADLLKHLERVAVDIRLCPDAFGLKTGSFTVGSVGKQAVLNVVDKPVAHWRQILKRAEDCVLSTLILALIAPLMLMIAAAVKLDSPGPVFFRQKRLGFNNRLIEVLKFRTMRNDMSDPNAERLATRNDARITRVGAFLRRTSLDELPQFINVLRGDMSIVGPRPHALAAKAGSILYPDAVPFYDARHRMKPGITGWAQVNGWRGETQTTEQILRRVEHDLFYVEHWSVVMDLKIILRTVLGGFVGKAAY